MRFTTRSIVVVLGTGALLFSACSSGGDTSADDKLPPIESSADANSATQFNDADVLFAQSMIPHHREAVEMAAIALETDVQASADVQALATQIQEAQDPEIEQMTDLLESWGQPVEMPGMEDMDGMDGTHDMGGMSAEEMDALSALTGAEFDAAWVSAMIVHHEGAVSMSETVKAAGTNADVLALADEIISGQQAEIDEMEALTAG